MLNQNSQALSVSTPPPSLPLLARLFPEECISKLSSSFIPGARREGSEEFRRVAPHLLLRKRSNSGHEPTVERWVGVEKPFRGREISEFLSFID